MMRLLFEPPRPGRPMMTIDELIAEAHAFARQSLVGVKGGQVLPRFVIQFKNRQEAAITAPWENDREKAAAFEAVRASLHVFRGEVVSYSFVSEVWMAEMAEEDIRHGLEPRQREDRIECVFANAFDHAGGVIRVWRIERDGEGVVSGLIRMEGELEGGEGRMHNLMEGD